MSEKFSTEWIAELRKLAANAENPEGEYTYTAARIHMEALDRYRLYAAATALMLADEIERLRLAIQNALDEFPPNPTLPVSVSVIEILTNALKGGEDADG